MLSVYRRISPPRSFLTATTMLIVSMSPTLRTRLSSKASREAAWALSASSLSANRTRTSLLSLADSCGACEARWGGVGAIPLLRSLTTWRATPLGEPLDASTRLKSKKLLSIITLPKMVLLSQSKETAVQQAITLHNDRTFSSLRAAARTTGAKRSTVGHRRAGRLPRSEITIASARLTAQQQEILR